MKQALFAIILTPISLLGIVYGQIPNGGFEDWEFIQNFEKPVGWNTNQDSNLIRFEKDTLSVEGSYSLKFVPSTYTAFYNCTSFAYKRIGLDGPIGENKSLTFFLRSVPDTLNPFESAYFEIKCAFFESGTLSSHYEWTTFEVIDDFIKIEIPIANSSVDSIGIFMYGGATNGATDACHYRSFSWVDKMRIETTTSASICPNKVNPEDQVQIFPNPSSGIIHIGETGIQFNKFELINAQGRTVEKGDLINSTLHIDEKGLFLLRLFSADGINSATSTKKILIK